MQGDRKAKLLYCMDYIMHSLNDEDAIGPWLTNGCPDGLYQTSPDPQASEYEDLDLTDEEFDEFVLLFAKTIAREAMPSLPAMLGMPVQKRVLV